VWDRNQVVTIIVALAREGHGINLRNISLSLSVTTNLSKERREDIYAAAQDILGDKATRSRIFRLRKKHRAIEDILGTKEDKGAGQEKSTVTVD
jgi:hypothetical protein